MGYDGVIDFKVFGLGDYFMEVECFIQYLWIWQEGVGDNVQFVVVVQMVNCVVDQCLGGFEIGLQVVMEWWVGDDYVEVIIDFGEDVVGKYIVSQVVGGKCCVVGFDCWGVDVVQGEVYFW